MSPKVSQKRIERLERIRDRLERDFARLQDDVDAAQQNLAEEANHDDDIAEVAALALGRDVELTLEEHVRQMLLKVERALEAAQEGEYGKCESCGKRIPAERLDAVPWAAKCVECKRAEEKR